MDAEIVHEAPGFTSLLGQVGDLLAANVNVREYPLVSRRPTKEELFVFPSNEAWAAAHKLRFTADVALLVGRRVAAAFGISHATPYYAPLDIRDTLCYVVHGNMHEGDEVAARRARNFYWALGSLETEGGGVAQFVDAAKRAAQRAGRTFE